MIEADTGLLRFSVSEEVDSVSGSRAFDGSRVFSLTDGKTNLETDTWSLRLEEDGLWSRTERPSCGRSLDGENLGCRESEEATIGRTGLRIEEKNGETARLVATREGRERFTVQAFGGAGRVIVLGRNRVAIADEGCPWLILDDRGQVLAHLPTGGALVAPTQGKGKAKVFWSVDDSLLRAWELP